MIISPNVGLPEVNVPVLSSITWFTLPKRSKVSPPRTMAPIREDFDNAAACGIAAASNNAQGQATTHNNRIIFQLSLGNMRYHTTKAPTKTSGTQIAVNCSSWFCMAGFCSLKL